MSGADPAPPPSFLPKRASTARNAASLYALQVANYLIPLMTLPFLVRHLGSTAYGQLAYAYAAVFLLVLAVDAGFNQRAARQLACVRDDSALAGRVIFATQFIKCIQVVSAALFLAAAVTLLPPTMAPAPLFAVSFMTVVGSLFFPIWIFQGLELMHFTTLCSLGGRLLATAGIFVFVDGPDDVLIAALLQSSGTFLSGVMALPIILRRLHIVWPRHWHDVRDEVGLAWSEGRKMALPDFANQMLTNSSVVVLGWFADASTVGTYAALEKLVRAGSSAFTPVAQALFPRVAQRHLADPVDARALLWRWSLRLAAAAALASLALAVLAEPVLELLFGPAWSAQAGALALFAPSIFFSVVSTVTAQLWLLARGLQVAWTQTMWICGALRGTALATGPLLGGYVGLVVAQSIAECLAATVFLRAARRGAGASP